MTERMRHTLAHSHATRLDLQLLFITGQVQGSELYNSLLMTLYFTFDFNLLCGALSNGSLKQRYTTACVIIPLCV